MQVPVHLANNLAGLFGQNKPATGGFGSSGTAFGGNNASTGFGNNTTNTTSNPFGANTGNTGFGASNSNTGTAFGASNTGSGAGFGAFGASNTANTSNNGTAAVPFQAVQEKETNGAVQHYQSVTFQDPYKNKCFEELRVEDYAQGRRFGNSNGQAGTFGQSTGFGGFGQNNTNTSTSATPFGNQQNNTATSGSTFGGFGANNTNTANTGAFGSNTSGGGLFGNQNKPAGGGLFGNTASTGTTTGAFGSTAGSGGGLFGNNAAQQQQPSNPFGGSTTNTGGGMFGNQNSQQTSNPFGGSTSNTGGGLFGSQNNQQQQNKPAFGGFGSTATTGGAFGANTNTGGGLFGSTNNQQQQGQQQSNPFGGSTNNAGGGLFGNQNKPAGGGLFGSSTTNTNTGGGMFGNQNQGNTGSSIFGNQNQAKPAGTGLFGSSTNTGGGLFGSSNQQNTGGGLFGGSANQNTGGSLFGNQNKPAGGSLFGNTGTSNTGGSLFGGNQQNQSQNTGNSLFGGGLGNSQQNQQNAGNSLFGNSNSQQQQQPNQLHASLTGAPYGNEQLFASLAAPSAPIGPLATPLNGARPAQRKTPSLMASMRLNTPVYSPRATGSIGRTGGYGFSYSTYGTPGSAFSGSLTPGASSLLRPTGSFGSALTSRLNKSISMGNLRGDGTPGEGRPSLLRESALSPPGSGANRYGSGSVRKLNIDRSLRTDLFGPSRAGAEQTSRSRVSFDRTAEQPEEIRREPQPSAENALVRTESEQDQEESPGLIRYPRLPNGGAPAPEMTQASGSNGLSSVPEDTVAQRPSSAPATQQMPAPSRSLKRGEMGEYNTSPSLKDLKNMSRAQLQKLGKFTVGREGVGRIEFGPCDLSTTPLDDICGNIVRLTPRTATVYIDNADKPAMGKALNVPSTIFLENSWPRSHGGKKAVNLKEGPAYDKHIRRLRSVGGTKFVNYEPETGIWQFTVDHFTTYGLDDEDEDDEEDLTEEGESSGLSEAPQTPGQHEEETMQSIETGTGEVDDTFQFKLDQRSQMSVPGGFEEPSVSYDYDDPSADEEMEEEQEERGETEMEDPFTSPGGAVQAPSPGTIDRYHSSMMQEDEPTGDVDVTGEEEEPSPEMPGSFAPEPRMPRSILKPSMGLSAFASPEKLATESWEEQLQRTISPKKRDRQALRDMQQSIMKAKEQEDVADSPFKQSLFGQSAMGQSAFGQSYLATESAKKGKFGGSTLAVGNGDLGKSQAFRTSMDIMNSLWATEKTGKKTAAGPKGFEV